MSEVNTATVVTTKQAGALIASAPKVRFHLMGEPGVGKSSVLTYVTDQLPTHNGVYLDMSTVYEGDTLMPAMDHENKVVVSYPSNRFKLHGKDRPPVAIMLDELFKSNQKIINAVHPLLESSNPRLGDLFLTDKDIVFSTGNITTDGVGDSIKSHSRNRIVPLLVRKPTNKEWLDWAVPNDIAPVMLAFANARPDMFESYIDNPETKNPYIFNPRVQQDGFFSPRSAEIASHILKVRDILDDDQLRSGLDGAIGRSASSELLAYVQLQDELPTWEAIVASPKTVAIPTNSGACSIVVYTSISRVDEKSMDALMIYLSRFEPEWQAVFARQLCLTPKKQLLAFKSKQFNDWLALNQDILPAY